LLLLKTEINSLRILINTAVEQFTTALANREQQNHATASPPAPESCAMETDAEHSTVTTPAILELIAELKHDIANIAIEMQAKSNQTDILKSINQSNSTSRNLNPNQNQCGSS